MGENWLAEEIGQVNKQDKIRGRKLKLGVVVIVVALAAGGIVAAKSIKPAPKPEAKNIQIPDNTQPTTSGDWWTTPSPAATTTPTPTYTYTPSPTYTPTYTPSPSYDYNANPTGPPTALCTDGTYSYSANHQGTCSHHGGVSTWLDGTYTPTPTPTYAAPPVDNTAQCQAIMNQYQDGTSPGLEQNALTSAGCQ